MQGFNMGRYYPPDASNAPSFNTSSHPLGKRASKISEGILTVRFELPFAVWCEHCTPPAIVGQGVRFNAEKKKVGKYYSTPIWSFRMKHSACGGWWEIKTDPKNAEYVIVQGAQKRDYGPEDKGAEADGDLKFLTEEERERRRNDAFANLEGKKDQQSTDERNRERLEDLYEKSEVWRDPYESNARLRSEFRVDRKKRKQNDRHKERMQERFSLGMEIMDETEADRVQASVIDFGKSEATGESTEDATWRPLFEDRSIDKVAQPGPTTKKLKVQVKADKGRQSLQHSLLSHAKAAIDPFLSQDQNLKPRPTFGVLKRHRNAQSGTNAITPTADNDPAVKEHMTRVTLNKVSPGSALVAYDSD
jgi:coiled-coil domain-containing protein 130